MPRSTDFAFDNVGAREPVSAQNGSDFGLFRHQYLPL